MSSRSHRHYRHRNRDDYYESEVKPHQSVSSSSSSSNRKDKHKHSEDSHSSKRKKSKRSHSRSRSKSPDRRRRSSDDRHHRSKSHSKSPQRRHGEARRSKGRRNNDSDGRRNHRSRSHSRSASRERERARERNKQEVKLQMQRNYEEQLEKMRTAALVQPAVPSVAPTNQASKLVEQIQQRKLLFSKKTEEPSPGKSTTAWKQPTFADDADGKMSAKFKRLMGMKDESTPSTSLKSSSPTGGDLEAADKKQQRFADLEKQYEVARMTTHTQRGMGLGFSSSSTSLR